MSFFAPTKTEPEVPVTGGGLSALRRIVHARSLKPGGLAQIASNVDGVGLSALEEFGHGRGTFPAAVLSQLATELTGFPAAYDPETDLLNRTDRVESKPLYTVLPPPFVRRPLSDVIGPPRAPAASPAPSNPNAGRLPRRAGWAD